MLRCNEQGVCNVSYMHPNQEIKFNVYYFKIDPTTSIAADFQFMNIVVESDNDNITDKLFVNKAVAIRFNLVLRKQIMTT